jgi:hypothetical protein
MATIAISDLYVPGADLFSDSESYLDEVSNSDVLRVNGGSTPACLYAAYVGVGIAGAALSYQITSTWTR